MLLRRIRSLITRSAHGVVDLQVDRATSTEACFTRLRGKALHLSSLINIGAGRGDDIAFFRNVWPELQALMIDMDERFLPNWRKLAQDFPVKHIVCGAGREDTEGAFEKSNVTGGALSEKAVGENVRRIPIRRIDTLVHQFGMPPPYFLKFDTHGVELDVLAGCSETLRYTNLIMMEAYNFKLNFVGKKNLTFDEMSLHMKSLGFRCVDICDPLFRPSDQALWQFHMLFIRDDHPVWSRTGYSS
jgi:FkbM family methyltransferase